MTFLEAVSMFLKVKYFSYSSDVLGCSSYYSHFNIVAQTGSRKRELASNNISSMKRRRLSSSTTAKISEVLSGPKYGSHREGKV